MLTTSLLVLVLAILIAVINGTALLFARKRRRMITSLVGPAITPAAQPQPYDRVR